MNDVQLAGLVLSLERTVYSLSEGETAQLCIQATGSIPESYSVDFSVLTSAETAQSESGMALYVQYVS